MINVFNERENLVASEDYTSGGVVAVVAVVLLLVTGDS